LTHPHQEENDTDINDRRTQKRSRGRVHPPGI
jgi:hypothetical protein